jgi:hypothetical protein
MYFKLLLCLPLLLLAYLFASYWRLRHVPGPFLASISKLWLLKWVVRGELHIGLLQACEKYGKIASPVQAKLSIVADLEVCQKAM